MSGDISRLESIAAHTRGQVAMAAAAIPLDEIRRRARLEPPARNFLGALSTPGVALIAEIKKASPAAGTISDTLDPADLARRYVAGGATALSVWTEGRYFHGYPAMVREMRAAAPVPVLRKDFILEPYQMYESRAVGADAVLLIAALLETLALGALIRLADDLGMAAAVDVHRDVDVDTAVAAGAKTIFIHNRDVGTFNVDLDKTVRMRSRIPSGVVVVSESGISTPEHVALLRDHVDAVLVGMGLMTSPDPQATMRALIAAGRRVEA
ncbi:MAG: indole-3-glycerol phosphate synthase TrpC [Armatimonadota bacterium]